MTPEQPVNLSANLPRAAVNELEELAKTLGTNRTTALRQAITLANLLYGEDARGGKITVKNGNTQRTVSLPKIANTAQVD